MQLTIDEAEWTPASINFITNGIAFGFRQMGWDLNKCVFVHTASENGAIYFNNFNTNSTVWTQMEIHVSFFL